MSEPISAAAAASESAPVVVPAPAPAAGKKAFPTPTGTVFIFDPFDLVIEEDESKPSGDFRNRHVENAEEWGAFVASIKLVGILQPVVVRKDGDKAVVTAGRRRVRAARQIVREGGTCQVPATLKRTDDKNTALAGVIENEQRRQSKPIEKAHAAQKLLDMGHPIETVAAVFSLSRQQLETNILPLLDLDEAVQVEVKAGEIPATGAVALTALPREAQKEAVAELKEEAKRTGKRTKNNDVRKKAAQKRGAKTSRSLSRPSVKDQRKAWLGAQVWAMDANLYKVKKETMAEIVTEILGWVSGETKSELADFLVDLQARKAKEDKAAAKSKGKADNKKG